VNITRRGFIFGAAGIAALAVSPAIAEAFQETEQQRLQRMIESGVIEDECFYLDGPVTISGVEKLRVNRCLFLYTDKFPHNLYPVFAFEPTPGQRKNKFNYKSEPAIIISHCGFGPASDAKQLREFVEEARRKGLTLQWGSSDQGGEK
jgi:hypothetical protein